MKKINILLLVMLFLGFYLIFASPVEALRCGEEKPDHAPDLFQIDAAKNSATLYFTPLTNAVTQYTIAYGYDRIEDRYLVSFPFGPSYGVISYTINYLNPNTKYYFRVRADNGCRHGYWSDTMSARTNWNLKKYYRVK